MVVMDFDTKNVRGVQVDTMQRSFCSTWSSCTNDWGFPGVPTLCQCLKLMAPKSPRGQMYVFQVYSLNGPELKLSEEMEKKSAFKCGTFGTASMTDRKLATGNFDGMLEVWDMDSLGKPIYSTQAHASIVNAIDGCGGAAKGYGPPELATCGRDGCVRVWDTRQESAPVAAFQPANKENVRYVLMFLHCTQCYRCRRGLPHNRRHATTTSAQPCTLTVQGLLVGCVWKFIQ